MRYSKTVQLKNGAELLLRSADAADGAEALAVFNQTHAETEYLLTYSDETSFTAENEAELLQKKAESEKSVFILAVLDGKVVGDAGFDPVGSRDKLKHRAEFGIAILKEYQGIGIGSALTDACIKCAKEAGYRQLELDVVAENAAAIALYKKHGFVEFGRNPRGFLLRNGEYQELVNMRLEL